jgi:hypothetical protein
MFLPSERQSDRNNAVRVTYCVATLARHLSTLKLLSMGMNTCSILKTLFRRRLLKQTTAMAEREGM